MHHDQNFKNLILDYPRQALDFFAPEEAALIPAAARILPVRQEQLQERMSERFRELDTPLLVEWQEGREAVLFLLEEESDPRRFSIHRLAHYCLDLAELLALERVVPVVIFLKPGDYRPDHVREVCRKDRSIAIAHGLEDFCEVGSMQKAEGEKGRRKRKASTTED